MGASFDTFTHPAQVSVNSVVRRLKTWPTFSSLGAAASSSHLLEIGLQYPNMLPSSSINIFPTENFVNAGPIFF